jgi:hypothetical protein
MAPTASVLKGAAGKDPVLFEPLEPDVYTYGDGTNNDVNQDNAQHKGASGASRTTKIVANRPRFGYYSLVCIPQLYSVLFSYTGSSQLGRTSRKTE